VPVVFRGSFGILAALLLATVACPIFLPLAPLLGYPALLVIAVGSALSWYRGRLDRAGQVASIWALYLGLILVLHGIVLCADTALAGDPPTAAQKRFGTGLAYLGGSLAATAAVAAYALEPGRGEDRKGGDARPDPIEDPTV